MGNPLTGTEYPGDGQDIALQVIISATGVQAVHPDGELAVAHAAASRGTAMGLSSFASKPIEDVVKANRRGFEALGDRLEGPCPSALHCVGRDQEQAGNKQ